MSAQHRPELQAVSVVNSRRKIPKLDGTYVSSNTIGLPSARMVCTLPMPSAPVSIPPTIEVSFLPGSPLPRDPRGGEIDMGADQLRQPGVLGECEDQR